MFPDLNAFDGAVMAFVQQRMHGTFADPLFIFFTCLGEKGLLWISLGLALCAARRTRRCGACILAALAVTFILGELTLKPLVARPRPCDAYPAFPLLISRPTGASFPSSHAATSFASAAVLFLHFRKPGCAALAAAALIAFSRVLLFVHYPTDILAGAILGVGIALAVCAAARRLFPVPPQ